MRIVQRYEPSPEDWTTGGLPSVWLAGRPHATPWSNDFSNIVGAFKWRN